MGNVAFATTVVGPTTVIRSEFARQLVDIIPNAAMTLRDEADSRLMDDSARSHLVIVVGPRDCIAESDRKYVDAWADSKSERARAIDRASRFATHLRQSSLPPDIPPTIHPWSREWAASAERIARRLCRELGDIGASVDHVGSTSVAQLAAKDIVDLQISVPDFTLVDAREQSLQAAGFVNVQRIAPDAPGVMFDNPRGDMHDRAMWAKRLYAGVDGDQRVILHVRRRMSPGWRYALLFRDWLRANEAAKGEYETVKRELAQRHALDAHFDDYARAKDAWFSTAYYASEAWAATVGWSPTAVVR